MEEDYGAFIEDRRAEILQRVDASLAVGGRTRDEVELACLRYYGVWSRASSVAAMVRGCERKCDGRGLRRLHRGSARGDFAAR